ncbi:ras protein [Mycena crocata]|nr:ras protein [Mycena crocata]
MEPKMSYYHIVLLGDTGVGKTCVAEQFTDPSGGYFKFLEEPQHVSDPLRRQFVVDNRMYFIELIEVSTHEAQTPGAEVEERMEQGQGFVLLYSITSRASFAQIESLHATVLRLAKHASASGIPEPPMILIANKLDKTDSREVSEEEGTLLARTIGCPFLEVSSKTGQNVDRTFSTLVRSIRAREVAADEASAQGNEQQKQKDGKRKKRLGGGKCVAM